MFFTHGVPGELWDASSCCCKSVFLPPSAPELMAFKELLESISPSLTPVLVIGIFCASKAALAAER